MINKRKRNYYIYFTGKSIKLELSDHVLTLPELPFFEWDPFGWKDNCVTFSAGCVASFWIIYIFSRPGQSQGLLYKHRRHSFLNKVSHPVPPTALWRRHSQSVWVSTIGSKSWSFYWKDRLCQLVELQRRRVCNQRGYPVTLFSYLFSIILKRILLKLHSQLFMPSSRAVSSVRCMLPSSQNYLQRGVCFNHSKIMDFLIWFYKKVI